MLKSQDSYSQNRITLGKVLATTALSCVPYLSVSGDLIGDTIKNVKLEKIPVKDAFVKSVKNTGKFAQDIFSFLKKGSSLKVGAALLAFGTIVDVLFTYWCVDKVANKISKKHKNN